MNDLARREQLPYHPSRFKPVGHAVECAGHFWVTQDPRNSAACMSNIGKRQPAAGRFSGSHEGAMAQAAREHDFDLVKARKLLAKYDRG